MFTLILIIITVMVLAEYYRSAKILSRRFEDFPTWKEAMLSDLRKKFAVTYFVLVSFHSILYTFLKLL